MQVDTFVATKRFSKEVSSVFSIFQLESVQKVLFRCPGIFSCGKDRIVAISSIGETRMKSLNTKYRQKTSSTDILSYEIHEDPIWGELYISPLDIAKNAAMLKHSFEVELIEILVHGFLHLTGLDHSDEMFTWQKELTDAILMIYETDSRAR